MPSPHLNLHAALKTEVITKAQVEHIDYALVRLQDSKTDIRYSLHVRPNSWDTSGVQTTDLLAYLGFERSSCSFVLQECYAHSVDAAFPLHDFAQAFPNAFKMLKDAEQHLRACGFSFAQPQGWGFFWGKPSEGRAYGGSPQRGDGHTAQHVQRMKDAEDELFLYVFTWLEAGTKGWTTHYRPKHPPLSSEMQAALSWLQLKTCAECPEFDFEPCSWRFTPFEKRGDLPWDSNAEFAHQSFNALAAHFSPGIQQLIAAHQALQPYNMHLLPITPQIAPSQTLPAPPTPQPEEKTKPARSAGAAGSTSSGKLIEYPSCFISYSSKDDEFAQQLYADLQTNNVPCWFAPENLPWGAKLRPGIDQAIHKHEKLLLVLSAQSMASDWVEQEVETAQERERQEKKLVLFPVRLDEVVMQVRDGWPAYLRNTRNIGDFTRWKDHDSYHRAFQRLLRDLKA